jgi:hypothetical protein
MIKYERVYTRCKTPTVLRQKNICMNPAGPGTNIDCAGEASRNLPEPETIYNHI